MRRCSSGRHAQEPTQAEGDGVRKSPKVEPRAAERCHLVTSRAVRSPVNICVGAMADADAYQQQEAERRAQRDAEREAARQAEKARTAALVAADPTSAARSRRPVSAPAAEAFRKPRGDASCRDGRPARLRWASRCSRGGGCVR